MSTSNCSTMFIHAWPGLGPGTNRTVGKRTNKEAIASFFLLTSFLCSEILALSCHTEIGMKIILQYVCVVQCT